MTSRVSGCALEIEQEHWGRPSTRFARSGHSPGEWLAMSEPFGSPLGETKASRMAGSTGLEPAASGVTGRRSNQLNYDPNTTITRIGNVS